MASAVLERPSKAATKSDNSPDAPLARRAYNGFPSPPHILIAGAGPVGLFLSLLLARSSIRITVLESAPLIQPSAKAMTHMPAIFPFFKKAGVWEALVEAADGLVDGKICFRRTADKSILGESPEGTGRPGPLTVSQHIFCEILLGKLGEFRNVDVRMGVAVSSVYNGRDKETVYVVGTATETSREEKFEATYVVGADGGRSFVRAAAEIKSDGETLLRDLVATDVYYPFDKYGWEGGNFMADPEHYGLIGPISTDGLWRVSFGVPVDTTTEEVQAMLPAKFEAMFPGPRPLDYKVKRLAVYKAQQVCAETMRKRRVLLVGDAAHLTNPYAGMGLASGLLDAGSLAEVLISHLQRGAEEKVLDSWATARRANFLELVDSLSRASFWELQDSDVDSLPNRHPILKSLKAGPGMRPPAFATDVTKLDGYVA